MEKLDVLTETVRHSLSGYALSKAILEDYAKVVARLENVPEEEVKDRVKNRTNEIFKETVENLRKQPEETMQS